MQLQDFLPPTIVGSLFLAGLWLLRNWIVERLGRSIQAEYDERLLRLDKKLDSDLRHIERQAQDALNCANRAAASGIKALEIRNEALTLRILDAAELVLEAHRRLSKALMAVQFVSMFRWENYDPDSSDASELAKIAKVVGGDNLDLANFNVEGIEAGQLYLSKETWNLFLAFRAIITFSVTRTKILEINAPKEIVKEDVDDEIIRLVPELSGIVEQHSVASYSTVADAISDALRAKLQEDVLGKDAGALVAREATSILEATKDIVPPKFG